jgi:hypothetical protein
MPEDLEFQFSPEKLMRDSIYLKDDNNKNKKGWGIASVLECLPSKLKALGSFPSTAKQNKKQ